MNVHIQWQQAENGSLVPGILQDQHFRPFHSLKDPEREAQRLAQSAAECNFLVILGGAALYHIPAYRPQRLIFLVIASRDLFIETRKRGLNSSLKERNDIIWLVRNSDEDAKQFSARIIYEFQSCYQPLFHGKLFIYHHRSLAPLYEDWFKTMLATMTECADRSLNDFLTQKRFGGLWLHQILKNSLFSAHPTKYDASSMNLERWNALAARWLGKRVVIAGAGPSLAKGIEVLQSRSDEFLLIASDTALPCLRGHSIQPQWVITIDPQQYSLLHYLSKPPSTTTLFYDIGANSAIPRLYAANMCIPLASPHPLSQWLMCHQQADIVAPINHSTNAGMAALALALAVQPLSIESYGIDFQNSGGKRYCRGSYQHQWAAIHGGRFTPAESYHYRLASMDACAEIIHTDGEIHYTSAQYDRYRNEFESLAQSWGEVTRETGYTIIPKQPPLPPPAPTPASLRKPASMDELWQIFANTLSEISAGEVTDFIRTFFSSPRVARTPKADAMLALMPWFANHSNLAGKLPESAFLAAIQFARERISHILNK